MCLVDMSKLLGFFHLCIKVYVARGFDLSLAVKNDNRFPLCFVYHMEKLAMQMTQKSRRLSP